MVIISPTRELSIQIYDQARKFAHNSMIKTVIIYGGTSTQHQRSQVQVLCYNNLMSLFLVLLVLLFYTLYLEDTTYTLLNDVILISLFN